MQNGSADINLHSIVFHIGYSNWGRELGHA